MSTKTLLGFMMVMNGALLIANASNGRTNTEVLFTAIAGFVFAMGGVVVMKTKEIGE